jgi:hypothetical protein
VSPRPDTCSLAVTVEDGRLTAVDAAPGNLLTAGLHLPRGDATVRVWNDQASIELPCSLDTSMRPGVCAISKGLWLRSLPAGLTANGFAPATISDLAGGACFNDARVDVAPSCESEIAP